MRSRIISLGILVALLVSLPEYAFAAKDCKDFYRNLKVGMSGEDVRLMQRILNSDARTTIASSGTGSPGSESTYFGAKTKLAVIKFQELYKSEVLTPANLSSGSGYVGALSRAKFAQLCTGLRSTNAKATQSTPVPAGLSPRVSEVPVKPSGNLLASLLASRIGKPYINSLATEYVVHRGEEYVVSGGGFAPSENFVKIGNDRYGPLSPNVDGALVVRIPAGSARGKFDVTVANPRGESNKTFVVVYDSGTQMPKITSFTPTSGRIGTAIRVTGENFSKTGNDIMVGAKTIANVPSSDGKTLYFTATLPVPGASDGQDVANVDASLPLWFYVVNENGVSDRNAPGIFIMRF
jgi:peptidoglycan hydrolase-like protein with peptidoglycan-binding domain